MNSVSKTVIRPSLVVLAWVTGMLIGCAPEILPPSGAHPVLSPEQVKIYQDQPKKYELLGTIEVPITPEMKWDERGDSTAGFMALKSKAAAMGANGVLLHLDHKQFNEFVGAGVDGHYYRVPIRRGPPRAAVAAAIFVVVKD